MGDLAGSLSAMRSTEPGTSEQGSWAQNVLGACFLQPQVNKTYACGWRTRTAVLSFIHTFIPGPVLVPTEQMREALVCSD